MQRSVRLCLILVIVALVGSVAVAAPQRAAPDEVGMSVSGVRKRLRGLRAELHDLVTEEEYEITP